VQTAMNRLTTNLRLCFNRSLVVTNPVVLICWGSYYLTALILRNRRWFLEPTVKNISLFVAFGVTYTVFSEIKNVAIKKLWAYSPPMPVIPYLNVGLAPIFQWIILPPIAIFITRRQLS
ncbi:MAG: hypothetical protein ACE5PV_19205, partial [Candidatus Poribacteria bacterium]